MILNIGQLMFVKITNKNRIIYLNISKISQMHYMIYVYTIYMTTVIGQLMLES